MIHKVWSICWLSTIDLKKETELKRISETISTMW